MQLPGCDRWTKDVIPSLHNRAWNVPDPCDILLVQYLAILNEAAVIDVVHVEFAEVQQPFFILRFYLPLRGYDFCRQCSMGRNPRIESPD